MSRALSLLAVVLVACLATTALAKAADSTKTGVIKSVDAKAKTFVLEITSKPSLTFTVDDKTVITLDGKASTMEAAIKADMKAVVTYAKAGDARVASKVEVTAPTVSK